MGGNPERMYVRTNLTIGLVAVMIVSNGCRGAGWDVDRALSEAIARRQQAAVARQAPVKVQAGPATIQPEPHDYEPNPTSITAELPAAFETSADSDVLNQDNLVEQLLQEADQSPTSGPTSRPLERYREHPFTLTEALRYAQQSRRELQTAKEDLYLAALALMLERHLWTPQFAAELRGVYGNFGEVTDFDQATRFMADLSVSQRLPYGGEFTAQAISTIIRDVKRSLTAEESGQVQLGFRVPLLRGAGYVSRETLINLERNLTYAVRTYERFQRRQLVTVARRYFDLLRSKQAVIDAETSVQRALDDYRRAKAFEDAGTGSPLDTQRAEQSLLDRVNRTAQGREDFRFATDQFKLEIGMPVDEPIGLDDLEDIGDIERQIREGKYPLLRRPPAASDEELSLQVAQRYRLDLLNAVDRVGDARRGVAISENALLPTLDWTGSLTFDTDPEHFRVAGFETARATWRTEVVLSMDDRYRERTEYRQSRVDLKRAHRNQVDALERVRVDVRRAINEIRLQERLLRIQLRNLQVAERRAEFARIQFNNGDIGNRDVVEAEDQLINAQNQLAQAKTDRWTRLLEYRLSTGTLIIDEDGTQHDPDLPQP